MLRMKLVKLVLAAAFALVPALAAAQETFPSSAGPLRLETIAKGLVHPWALQFLPGGRMLVTERPGRMRIVAKDGALSPPLKGVPEVSSGGQAGLLDVRLDRNYAQNRTLYFCFNYDRGGAVAVARAFLDSGAQPGLEDVSVIFRQKGAGGAYNNACRIVQAPDNNLFVTLGDHFHAAETQRLDNHLGKIIRITPRGEAPPDNPFVDKAGALPEIWAYGLRNAEGLALNPANGKLWEQEHGPMGGDEINIIAKGANYGWGVVSLGVNYDGTPVGAGKRHASGMTDPVWHWTPSIAPSGMAFITGDLFHGWKGSLVNGALKFKLISRLTLDGDKAVREERLLQKLNERIRDVREGPGGALYLLTDNEDGRILRLTPEK
jgi:glucose/arabinose dehydrogenase